MFCRLLCAPASQSCSSGFIIKTSFDDIMAGLNSITEKLAETWLCLNFRVLFAWQQTNLTKPGFYFGKITGQALKPQAVKRRRWFII